MDKIDFIDPKSLEYKTRFIDFLVSCGIEWKIAVQELAGIDIEELSNPELDASDCMSYWGD